jgi:hypothetical protein
MTAFDLFYWTGVLWWACLGLSLMAFGLRQMWLGFSSWWAIRQARRIPIPAAPFQVAPLEPARLGLHVAAGSPAEAAEKIAAGALDDCADGP